MGWRGWPSQVPLSASFRAPLGTVAETFWDSGWATLSSHSARPTRSTICSTVGAVPFSVLLPAFGPTKPLTAHRSPGAPVDDLGRGRRPRASDGDGSWGRGKPTATVPIGVNRPGIPNSALRASGRETAKNRAPRPASTAVSRASREAKAASTSQ